MKKFREAMGLAAIVVIGLALSVVGLMLVGAFYAALAAGVYNVFRWMT